jgi:hypothetical protein
MYIGNYLGGTRAFDGTIDEVRISSSIRSGDWVITEYNNQLNPETYISIDSEIERQWFDASFSYQKDILLNESQVTGDLSHFPLLLEFTDTDLKNGKVQSNAADILFVDSIGNKLDHEIENFTQTSSNGRLVVWIDIPHLFSEEKSVITMYYGNSKVSSQENPAGVWDSNFKGVWHLNEDPTSSAPQFIDSTSNDNDGSASNLSLANQVTGQIEGGLSFDDTDRNVDIPDSTSLQFSTDIWVSAWIKTTDTETDVDVVLTKWASSAPGQNYWLGKLNQNTFVFYVDSTQHVDINLNIISDGEWHYVVGIADSVNSQLRLYVDGVEEGTAAYDGSSVADTTSLYIGQSSGEIEQEWNGEIDECRVSNVIHSGSWILTEYYNQFDPISTSSRAMEFSLDVSPPVINDFGTEDSGTGTGRFWADVSDSISGVDSVTIKINGTEYDMSFNGSKWIYLTSVEFGKVYEYQIVNSSDVRENYITSPSSTKFTPFTEDSVTPDVVDWEYYPDEGIYGTFKANVSDSWGSIDMVIVNVTEGTVPQGERWAVMKYNSFQYLNDTVIMGSGSIKFVITVNDTAGNFYTSSEHQGFVPIINHPPEAQNITLSRSSSAVLLPIYSNSTLYLDYDFYDQDDDSEGGTEIRWYKNGVLQSAYNDQTSVPDTALFKGDEWNATIKPKDGQKFGTMVASLVIIIQNTPPVVISVIISPSSPFTSQQLSVTNSTSDEDNDGLTFEIKWFNPVENSSYQGLVLIDSTQTMKGETWWSEVRTWDGTNYSSWVSSNNVTIQNSDPVASSLEITPSNAKTSDTLNASYFYTDVNGDAQSGSHIRWYKNGVPQNDLNDSLTVDSSRTLRGENWYFTVEPSDGTSFGNLKTSPVLNIANTAPNVSNLEILPITAQTDDSLIGNYSYSDNDNDPESGLTEILWYLDGILQGDLNGSKTVSSTFTTRGEVWHFKIRPDDGTDFGSWVSCSTNITIQNTTPTASNLQISPSDAKTSDTLATSYDYSDADNDLQSGSKIVWYRNGLLVDALNDSTSVNPSYTTKGDSWHFKVQPNDGTEFGAWFNCPNNITIANTIPTASGLIITPNNPFTSDSLIANWTFSDLDGGDTEVTYYLNWTRGTTHQSVYDGLTTLLPSASLKNQVWYFTLIVFDGTDNSTFYTSPSVEILNTPPTASGITLTPSSPNTTSTLTADWLFSDNDTGDSESTLWLVYWYKDGILQASYNNSKTIPSITTSKSEVWNFTVKVYDGSNYSIQYNSSLVTILNSPPIVSEISFTSNPTTTDDLIADWTATDEDGDDLAMYLDQAIVHWYNWSGSIWVELTQIENSTTLGAGNTSKGEVWYYSLLVFDGTDYSTVYDSPNRTILNSLPSVTNPTFNKTSGVITDDTINISYSYSDADGDLENINERIVYWYKDGSYWPSKDNHSILYYTDTLPDEFWQYIIKVYDGYAHSQNYSSSLIIIGGGSQENTAPEANNVELTANTNTTSENLESSYTYYDTEGNLQTDFEIFWYKDGVLQSLLNDYPVILYSYTAKGEEWNFTLRVYDGLDWSIQYNSSLVTIVNSIPEAVSLTIPLSPTTTEDLDISWSFNDADSGDSQTSFSVMWYINGVYHSEYNNFTTIDASETTKGENWSYTLVLFDGEDYSQQVNSSISTIVNTPPIASVVSLTSSPTTNSTLSVSYSYDDADNDSENGNWIILWYKDDVLQPGLNNSVNVNSGNTTKNEFWHFSLQVFDGEDYSPEYASPSRKILNTAPTLSSLTLPSTPYTTDDLIASWSYSDVDGDPESTTIILHWYKNGVFQPAHNDTKTLQSSTTTKGDEWNFTIKVFDGTNYSKQYNSSVSIILNSAPTSSNLLLEVSFPQTTDDLIAQWDYLDADGDPEDPGWRIRWYKNGVHQATLDDSLVVSKTITNKTELWYYTLEVYDGEEYSILYTLSPQVQISNSAPSVTDINITASPTTTDDLVVNYTFHDADDDLEPINSWTIRWYRNGFNDVTFNDLKTILSSETTRGELWYYTLQVYDGTNTSIVYTSPQRQIKNSVPTINNLSFSPASPTTEDDLTYNVNYDDLDLDPQSSPIVRWYRNDILQSSYNDIDIIDKSLLIKGDQWNLSIKVSDGTDYSEWSNISVFIQNSAPSVVEFSSYIYVPPSGLFTTNILIANWENADADGDSIVDSYIKWFKFNGSMYEIFDLENDTQVPPSYTKKGDEWRFRVQIFDGEDWSAWSSDAIQIITNSKSIIENVTLSGGASTTNDIILSYDFEDVDNDSDFSKIEWKIVHLGSVNTIEGNTILSSTVFTAGDLIWVVITPDDNEDTGQPLDSSTLSGSQVMKLVGNTAPQINTTLGYPIISSDHENSSTIYNPQIPIYLEYDSLVFDIDSGESDPIYDINKEQNADVQNRIVLRVIGAQYRWYKYNSVSKNWELQPELTRSYIDPFYLHRDDLWMGSIRPRDQYGYYGSWVNSSSIEIGNSFPEVIGFSWSLLHPTTSNNLEFSFNYFDFDGDPLVESQTMILWYKNGILILSASNQSTLSSSNFIKGDNLNVIIRPYDGTDWALGNFTSPIIGIENSIPVVTSFTIAPTTISNIDVLLLNWTYLDVDGDVEDSSEVSIRWYRNGLPEFDYTNLTSIPLVVINNGDLWRADFSVSDGLNYSIMYSDNIVTRKLSIEYIFDRDGQVDPYNVRSDQFYVEDENISIDFFFDSEGDVLNARIIWYNDFGNDSWHVINQYENYTEIPYDSTILGQKWKCMLIPFDGSHIWARINSSDILIESRPSFITSPDEVVSVGNDTEGHYTFNVTVNDVKNPIVNVEYTLNDTIGGIRYAVNVPGTDIWILEYRLSLSQFNELSGSLIVGEIKVVTSVGDGQTFDIYQLLPFNFLISDSVAPRVTNAFFTYNSTSITFFAELEEFGSEISNVNLYYYFESISANTSIGVGSSIQQSEYFTRMVLLNTSSTSSFFSTAIPFDGNGTDWKVIYRIETIDSVGNINPQAYDVLRDNPESVDASIIYYVPPGLPRWMLLVAGLAMFLTFIGAIVYVKYIRKPEIVGLDKELVLSKSSEIREDEVTNAMELHTIGVVVSFFDQRHGPIPIIVIPEILKDNFTKLVELSDRSFSSCGFADDFSVEIPSSYDFVLTQGIRISSLSFGYALERPEARGAQENITLNMLVHQDLFPLVESFKDEIKEKVHKIHVHMDKKEEEQDIINNMIFDLRKFLSRVILAYEQIYGTTELIREDS